MESVKKLCLIILDGWGIGDPDNGNAIYVAKPAMMQEIEQYYPSIALSASGLSVGLPWGEAGNSEVGHLTIGAGFIPYQALPRINMAIKDGSFFDNPVLQKIKQHLKSNDSTLHVMGLLTSGSVHAYLDHIFALVEWAKNNNVAHLALHLFTDGRDSGSEESELLLKKMFDRTNLQKQNIGTIIGRFYSMDRDNKWDRIDKTYQCLTQGQGEKFSDPLEYLKTQHKNGTSDEFIAPASNEAINAKIKENDAVIFFNFREDSVRELVHAFLDENFTEFNRQEKLKNLFFATFTQYEENLPASVLFPPLAIDWPLARVLSENGFKQIHIAETEKYAHITYFLNGMHEAAYPDEERILIPSVSTDHFDDQPEMSAAAIVHHILRALETEKPTVILANFANTDMVGHTGNFQACLKAVKTIDSCLAEIIPAALKKDWAVLITADHGNIEHKINTNSGEPLTEHSLNPVPFYLIGKQFRFKKPKTKLLAKDPAGGLLADVAPTLLHILEIEPPQTMTGQNLLPLLTNK